MSLAKRLMEELETRNEIAVAIALRVGLLEHCDTCDDVYDPLEGNFDDAYRLANHLVSKCDPLVEVFKGDRRALTDAIKDVTQNYGQDCHCAQQYAKLMAKD